MKLRKVISVLCLSTAFSSVAQVVAPVTSEGPSGEADKAGFEFAKPKPVQDLSSTPTIAGRFDCDEEGSIYTFIDGYSLNNGTNPGERSALLAIHPDGAVTNFPYRISPGFTDFSMPKSIFVGNGHVYVLVNAQSDSAGADGRRSNPLVLTFDKQGALVNTMVPQEDINPLVLGVFPSGDVILISEDRLNHRMTLSVYNPDGVPVRESKLGDSDFIVKSGKMSSVAGGPSGYSPLLLISMSKFFPSGDHLQLVPFETSGLPIVELDEHGVLQSTVPRFPEGTVIDGFVSSDTSSWKLRLGAIIRNEKQITDAQGRALGVATRPVPRISEFSRVNGNMSREIGIGGVGVQPACEAGGEFRFLTASVGGGRLQVVTAQIREK